jgi:hypothetical protein
LHSMARAIWFGNIFIFRKKRPILEGRIRVAAYWCKIGFSRMDGGGGIQKGNHDRKKENLKKKIGKNLGVW